MSWMVQAGRAEFQLARPLAGILRGSGDPHYSRSADRRYITRVTETGAV
jgi:hypothetical protein